MKNKSICPICGCKDFRKFIVMPGYILNKCKECGMAWDPFASKDIKSIYNKEYFINDNPKGGYKNYFEGMRINRKTFKQRMKKIARLIKQKKALLDLGCALGDCLLEAKNLGWKEVEGIDLSRYACKFAKKRGLRVRVGSLESLRIKKNRYNVVLCQDVIEHLHNPIKTLNHIARVLKPNGLLYIVTPNISGNWSRLLGRNWYHYKPNEHVLYFSPKTMRLALSKSLFENIKIRPAIHIMSVEYILQRLVYYSPILAKILLRISRYLGINNLSFRIKTGEMEIFAYNSKKC